MGFSGMSEEQSHHEMDYNAHNSTYGFFLGLLKWGTILAAIATVAAIIAIT